MSNLDFLTSNPEIAKHVTVSLKAEDLVLFLESLKKQFEPIREALKDIPNTDEKLRTVEETAEIFGVSRVTLWQWGKKGILNPVKIGHVVRYKESEINHVLSSLRPQFSFKNSKQLQA